MRQTIILFLAFGWTTCFCQQAPIKGIFRVQYIPGEENKVRFEGQNVTKTTLFNLKVTCINEFLGDTLRFSYDFLKSNDIISIGGPEGWTWQPGERIYISINDEKILFWRFAKKPSETLTH